MKGSTIYVVDTYTKSQQNQSLQVKFYFAVVDHIIVSIANIDHDCPCKLL
jgi:hypothetical protein